MTQSTSIRYVVETTVKGAYRINRREFDSLDEAEAFAARWRRSNSTGHYVAHVEELPAPEKPTTAFYETLTDRHALHSYKGPHRGIGLSAFAPTGFGGTGWAVVDTQTGEEVFQHAWRRECLAWVAAECDDIEAIEELGS